MRWTYPLLAQIPKVVNFVEKRRTLVWHLQLFKGDSNVVDAGWKIEAIAVNQNDAQIAKDEAECS